MKKTFIMSLALLSGLSAQAKTTNLPQKAESAKAESKAAAPEVKKAPLAVGSTVNITLTKDNTLVMNDYFEPETVANLVQKAKQMDAKLKSGDPLFLVINSGGGDIDSGIEMITNLNNLNRPVHTISTFSASMGFQTVQGVNGKRLVTPDGTLMSHKAKGGFSGEFPGQLDSRYQYYLKRVARLDERAVARTNGKHTLESYRNLIENEYWCDGKDCIAQGFADYIVNASCDASMSGQHNKLDDRFLYMGHTIEIIDVMSDCPMITSALTWNILIDGQPLFQNNYTAIPDKTKLASDTTVYHYDYNVSLKDSLGIETVENIKKLVAKRLDSRGTESNRKNVRKY